MHIDYISQNILKKINDGSGKAIQQVDSVKHRQQAILRQTEDLVLLEHLEAQWLNSGLK